MTERAPFLDLMLPYPPTLNTGWRCLGGRVVLAKRQRVYRRIVREKLLLVTADPDSPYTTNFGHKALNLTIVLCPPTRRRYDLDNVVKPCVDALMQAGVMVDDSQIVSIQAEKAEPSPPTGYAWVSLQALPGGVPGESKARAAVRNQP
jgi:crossover junction endodeoxyribonuclease RusA